MLAAFGGHPRLGRRSSRSTVGAPCPPSSSRRSIGRRSWSGFAHRDPSCEAPDGSAQSNRARHLTPWRAETEPQHQAGLPLGERTARFDGGTRCRGQSGYAVGWGTLALINAGLAQGKGRSGLFWLVISLLLGPLATLLIVLLPMPWCGGTPTRASRLGRRRRRPDGPRWARRRAPGGGLDRSLGRRRLMRWSTWSRGSSA